MVLELTILAGAVGGVIHRLGKLDFIPNYGQQPSTPAAFKLVTMAMLVLAVATIGNFETFQSGLMFGLVALGSWKIAEEAAETVIDL
ncbi:MAG: hypothetical protein KDD90_05145, partial [Sphingomonadaceae bacterium]|nr:hypothetical protein [Sphingomonadaceae bacterium]